MINQGKSVFKPSRTVTFLGFVLDTDKMTVRLTGDKLTEIGKMCKWCRNRQSLSIQDLASLIGKLVAYFPAVRWAVMGFFITGT